MRTRPRHAVALIALLALAACGSSPAPGPGGSGGPGGGGGGRPTRTPVTVAPGDVPTPPAVEAGPALLASGFERPICGRYQHPGPGCEFGYEGDDLETGSFDCRTGESCLRIGRVSHSHMGVIREVPIPGGTGFVGVAQRIPDIPHGAIPAERGYIELLQLSPTDGVTVDGYPVEVRFYPDRRLGLALYREKDVAVTRRPMPVDEWFVTVVELNSGAPAEQRLWVFDDAGALVDYAAIELVTRQRWAHSERTAQKVGGATSTLAPMDTFADDWWISESFLGPARIAQDGSVSTRA